MSLDGIIAVRGATPPGQQNAENARDVFQGNQEQKSAGLLQRETVEELTPALEKLNKTAPIFDFRFHFKIHEATQRIMVQIIDRETGEVINEIPPEKILDLVARIQELVGILVDEKV